MGENHADDVAGVSAKGHAEADFRGSLRNRVGHDAIDADQGEGEGNGGEDEEQESLEAALGDGIGDDLIEGFDVGEGLVFVDGPDGVLEGGDKGEGIVAGTDGEVGKGHGIGVILRGGEVDTGVDGFGPAVAADVGGDADDGDPGSTGTAAEAVA